MALTKVTYVDNVTVIGATNLNAIQDEIIANGNNISSLQSGKVDKDGNKVLSTNDFTNENLSKLNGIEAQATRVLVDTALSGTSTNAIQNKAVKDALDEQSQRIDNASGSVADVYTPQAYSIGDYVTHDNKLYRATVDIPTAEVWDETHWEEVNVADVVAELQEDTAEVKDIAFAGFPTDTASGAIATFSDGADNVPIKSLSVAIEPVQDLHGYDNPWPEGGGKNLFYPNIGWTVNESEIVETGRGNAFWCTSPIQIGNNTSFAVKIWENPDNVGGSFGVRIFDDNGIMSNVSIASLDAIGSYPFTSIVSIPSGAKRAYFRGYNSTGITGITNLKAQVEFGTEPTDYSPYSNICPISGHTECNVTRTGKNLCPTPNFTSGTGYTDYIFIDFDEFPSYMFSCSIPSAKLKTIIYAYDIKKNLIARMSGASANPRAISKASFTYEVTGNMDDAKYISIQFYSYQATASDINNGNVQVEIGSTTTAYEPYQSTTYPITFPSGTTVYGGHVTVEKDGSGTLVVDKAKSTLSQVATDWAVDTGTNKFFKATTTTNVKEYCLCESYATIASINASNTDEGILILASSVTAKNIRVRDNRYTDVTSWLNDMGSTEVLYELATPVNIPLTAEQVGIITSLYGTNNIWADTGDVSVTYRADTQMFINARDKAITQSIAPIENGTTSSNAYAQGDYFFHNAKFCKALTAIASGATFTLNTNYAETTVAEELATILNV